MEFLFDINDIFEEATENNNLNSVSIFDYTAKNTNLMLDDRLHYSNECIFIENQKKNCSSFHNCLQFYNTMPHVNAVDNVPIENVLPNI